MSNTQVYSKYPFNEGLSHLPDSDNKCKINDLLIDCHILNRFSLFKNSKNQEFLGNTIVELNQSIFKYFELFAVGSDAGVVVGRIEIQRQKIVRCPITNLPTYNRHSKSITLSYLFTLTYFGKLVLDLLLKQLPEIKEVLNQTFYAYFRSDTCRDYCSITDQQYPNNRVSHSSSTDSQLISYWYQTERNSELNNLKAYLHILSLAQLTDFYKTTITLQD